MIHRNQNPQKVNAEPKYFDRKERGLPRVKKERLRRHFKGPKKRWKGCDLENDATLEC